MYYGLLQEPRVKRRGLCSRVAVLALSLSSDFRQIGWLSSLWTGNTSSPRVQHQSLIWSDVVFVEMLLLREEMAVCSGRWLPLVDQR